VPPAKLLMPSSAADGELALVHEILQGCHQEISPREPYRSLADTVGFLRFPPAAEARVCWTVAEGGALCGFAAVRHRRGAATGWLELQVHPGQRRHKVGTVLLAAARAYASASGVRTLLGHYAGIAGAGFCHAVGAGEGQRDVRSMLRIGPALLAPVPVRGYRLVRWTGECPNALLVSYAAARGAINDAPHADGVDEDWSPVRVRDLEAMAARRGRDIRVTAVMDGRAAVAAFTEMRVSPSPSALASVEDTAVIREHRGKGLATWVKTAALETLRQERADVAFVVTSNAWENWPIRAINLRMGFEPVLVWTTAVLAV
jgi:mycothiol synthase